MATYASEPHPGPEASSRTQGRSASRLRRVTQDIAKSYEQKTRVIGRYLHADLEFPECPECPGTFRLSVFIHVNRARNRMNMEGESNQAQN